MSAELVEVDKPDFDPVDIALACCGGDARATIWALLEELRFVRG